MLECLYCEKSYTRESFKNTSIHNCFTDLTEQISLLKETDDSKYLFKKKMLPVDEAMDIDVCDGQGQWSHVRHVPSGTKWYKAKDQLNGTEIYGNNNSMDEEWSV